MIFLAIQFELKNRLKIKLTSKTVEEIEGIEGKAIWFADWFADQRGVELAPNDSLEALCCDEALG